MKIRILKNKNNKYKIQYKKWIFWLNYKTYMRLCPIEYIPYFDSYEDAVKVAVQFQMKNEENLREKQWEVL